MGFGEGAAGNEDVGWGEWMMRGLLLWRGRDHCWHLRGLVVSYCSSPLEALFTKERVGCTIDKLMEMVNCY